MVTNFWKILDLPRSKGPPVNVTVIVTSSLGVNRPLDPPLCVTAHNIVTLHKKYIFQKEIVIAGRESRNLKCFFLLIFWK